MIPGREQAIRDRIVDVTTSTIPVGMARDLLALYDEARVDRARIRGLLVGAWSDDRHPSIRVALHELDVDVD